jgi:hypothetical protein
VVRGPTEDLGWPDQVHEEVYGRNVNELYSLDERTRGYFLKDALKL